MTQLWLDNSGWYLYPENNEVELTQRTGGVHVSSNSTFTLSGNVKVTDNKSGGSSSNVYLSNNCVITIGGQLTGDSKISVDMQPPGVT